MIAAALRAGAACLLATAAGCAHVEAPTGGPDDKIPPGLVITRPDTLALVPGWDSPVVFQFDERISEQRVEDAVMVSPRTSPVVVDRGGSSIRVSLRRGWEPGTIYHVTIRPLIQDLFNNRLARPAEVVFSTGPAIPDTRLTGTVVDRITGKPDVDTRVEAIRVADSLVYAVVTDSAGRFVLARIPEGEYRVRSFRDPNRNRALDLFEPRDSTAQRVAVGDTVAVRLAVVLPDSTAPRAASAERTNDRRVEVRFDDYLDPAQAPAPADVRITGADGSVLPVSRVVVGTIAATRSDTARAAAQRSGAVAAPDTAAADTAAAPLPLPAQALTLELEEGAQLAPGQTYQVRVRGVRNVVGLSADVETELVVPAAPAAGAPAAVRAPVQRGGAEPHPTRT